MIQRHAFFNEVAKERGHIHDMASVLLILILVVFDKIMGSELLVFHANTFTIRLSTYLPLIHGNHVFVLLNFRYTVQKNKNVPTFPSERLFRYMCTDGDMLT